MGVMLAAAWWSTGFIHGDEHFQVLEFANARLGRSPVADLPWEYAARARSWVLPALAACVRWTASHLGLDDPFRIAIVLRFMSGLVYLCAAHRLARAARPWFRSRTVWQWAVYAGVATWFIPIVTARLSAESWSGSLFFLGLATAVRVERGERVPTWERWLAGAAFGLAFVVRFQVLLLELGALAWLERSRARQGGSRATWIVPIMAGCAAAILAAAALDRWGYGAWSFPLWNYYRAQLVGGVLESYGTSPWWWYAPDLVHRAGAPIGLLLLGGFAVLCARRPRSVLVWVVVPYVAFHLLIGHKETRFLFPLVTAAPYVVFLALDQWTGAGVSIRWQRGLAGLAIAANAIPFAARLAVPMEPRVAVARAVAREAMQVAAADGVTHVYVAGAPDPYVWWGLRAHWYDTPGIVVARTPDMAEATRRAALVGTAIIVTRATASSGSEGDACEVVHRSVGLAVHGRLMTWLVTPWLPARDQEPWWWVVERCGVRPAS